ncbi:cellulose synthase-like protein E6 [Cinnamomum micranthum f. kanehirae]|uniref:Cellulose synthase-like protein E6 n=1 Tax=Cinnamomum micranthum f. kanehirae TaxID=337451 RepID=A0A3S3P7Q4_9MAGN|nr:cellulose synthase-like protein E6 [Cinnamomum micranthum f. kanehirae]
MEDLIQSVVKLGRVNEEIQAEHKGFSEWNSVLNSRNHQTILQILIDGRDPNAVDNAGFVMPTLVYLSREKRPRHHHNFKAGALNALRFMNITKNDFYANSFRVITKMGLKYGCLVEDVTTGLAIHSRRWKKTSAYLFGTIDCGLNLLGITKLAFPITVKIVDDELSKRYEQEIMEFGTTSPMFTVLATLAMINLLNLLGWCNQEGGHG